jgi:hypothetical protein
MIGKRVTKYFPGHGAFKGTVQEYATKTDNYLVVYDDGDQETIKYRDLLQCLPGHPDFISTQANFIALSARHGMQKCNPLAVPFPANCDDILAQLATPIENPDPKLVKEFQTLCGGLLYVQVHTCPEISFVVSLLSRHMTKTGELHIAFAKKVLRYLQSRKHLHLSWSARSCHTPHVPDEIYGWSDASFADIKSHDGTNRASSIGWIFMCNNRPISWRSTKTPLIALNVAESEIIALSSASQEAIFLRKP